jgi:hypothetical protein
LCGCSGLDVVDRTGIHGPGEVRTGEADTYIGDESAFLASASSQPASAK